MEQILKTAGIEVTKENKKDIDRAIHKITGINYKDCPDAWKKVKEIIKTGTAEEKESFILKLKKEASGTT
ncbi:MAG: hypothetical protein FJW68_02170 [Actinobacteria bacterium]|nr:hypothetical protein [Actinomycetota bacterium]